MHKAIIWGTGRSGKALLRAVLDHPAYALVGVWVHSPEKAGIDAGTLIGAEPTGVLTTADKQAIARLDADIVFQAVKGHALVPGHDDDVVMLLESGKNVVSTRGYLYPWMVSQDYAARFERACRTGGASLYALGNNPGFIGERLMMAMTGGALHIDGMEIVEAYDCSHIDQSTFHRMGFSQRPEDMRGGSSNWADYEYLYAATFHYVIESMGGTVERLDKFEEVVVADRLIEDTRLPIAPGAIRGLRLGWTAIVAGRPFMTLDLRWWAGPAITDWPQKPGWTIRIAGNPPMKAEFGYDGVPPDQGSKGLIPGLLLNSGLAVIEAPPGIVRTPAFATYRLPAALHG